ncbi:hypothetical protein SY89_01926 [Halolamina pelagica]|uniref:Uncharacterized protein n=1 Tax=Halolamina pelagica TaxID=699431 RepID=A0A0P7GZS2_9EURY|nr:hypothetical protein [Halolamina pelagica]KPN31183.1 hypothetical protein SY89_01926 [Halolamina pelagica]
MGERGNDRGRTGRDPQSIRGDHAGEQAASAEADAATTEEDRDRIAALEARLDRLEAASDERAADSRNDRVGDLAEEVAALRETTDRLESTLSDAVAELDTIRQSEYGAIDEKRERQFETAVKSMVAFHQLATDVLDVQVENYEPAAGHADAERVEATRERIADALGVGQAADTGDRLEMDDEAEWPDPEEAASGGRVFGDDASDRGVDEPPAPGATDPDEPPESDAPETGSTHRSEATAGRRRRMVRGRRATTGQHRQATTGRGRQITTGRPLLPPPMRSKRVHSRKAFGPTSTTRTRGASPRSSRRRPETFVRRYSRPGHRRTDRRPGRPRGGVRADRRRFAERAHDRAVPGEWRGDRHRR